MEKERNVNWDFFYQIKKWICLNINQLIRTTLHEIISSLLNRVLGVLACFGCLRPCVLTCLACLRAYMLTYLRACVLGVLACLTYLVFLRNWRVWCACVCACLLWWNFLFSYVFAYLVYFFVLFPLRFNT